MRDLAAVDDLIGDGDDALARNSKPDSLRTCALRGARLLQCRHTDHGSVERHERSARVTRIDWGRGLNCIRQIGAVLLLLNTVETADEPRGYAAFEAKWVTDGQYRFANLIFSRLREVRHGQIGCLYADDREVVCRVGAHQRR